MDCSPRAHWRTGPLPFTSSFPYPLPTSLSWNSASTPSRMSAPSLVRSGSARTSACATSSRRSSSPTRSGSTCSASASTTGPTMPSRRLRWRSRRRPTRTSRIRLTSAVTVLSSDDPVRVFQQFATLDLLSRRARRDHGRPRLVHRVVPAVRLRARRLRRAVRRKARPAARAQRRRARHLVGQHRAADQRPRASIRGRCRQLPIWIAVGGTPQSVVRAGTLGLPLALAIIGGEPARFAPLFDLYREAARRAGHDAGDAAHLASMCMALSVRQASRPPTISTGRRPR